MVGVHHFEGIAQAQDAVVQLVSIELFKKKLAICFNQRLFLVYFGLLIEYDLFRFFFVFFEF